MSSKKAASTVLKAKSELAELEQPKTTAAGTAIGLNSKSHADFPICTALSPSAKAIKVPNSKKYYNHQHKPLLEQAGKRLSLDSGYAESNLSNDSNEQQVETEQLEVGNFISMYYL